MKHASRPQSVAWFQDHYKAGRLELRPPFQRKPVWSSKQRCALVESILLDIPIPEVYIQVTQAEDGTENYGIVDGQQRLRTILQFIGIEREQDGGDGESQNNFALEHLPPASPHKDLVFGGIPVDARKLFFQYEICVRFLYSENLRDVEDIFKRLNKYTMPLKPQELRNATYHGPFAKLSEQLADEEYWAVNRIISPATIRRMGDIEMMSDLIIGLLHGPQGGAAKIIDQYYEEYEPCEDEFPEQPRIKRMFQKSLDTIKRVFPELDSVPRWGNRADFYSLFVALGSLLNERDLPTSSDAALRQQLSTLAREVNRRIEHPTAATSANSKKYARAIEKGSNDRARRMDRHEVLCAVISPLLRQRS